MHVTSECRRFSFYFKAIATDTRVSGASTLYQASSRHEKERGDKCGEREQESTGTTRRVR